MTEEDITKVIDAYDALCEKAILIADGPPFHKLVDIDAGVVLAVEDSEVILSWQETEGGYDGGAYLRTSTLNIPIAAMLLTVAQIKASHKHLAKVEKEREAREHVARQEAAAIRQEAFERAEYLRLVRKFSGNPYD